VRPIAVTLFAHTRDNTGTRHTLDFPDAFDAFREADARVVRPFLDYDFHKTKPPTVSKHPGKNGPLWSPALFNGERNKPNVVSVCALVLDYDHGDLPAEEVVARWEKYEHVLHSTYTPGRWRVILPYATPITPAQHDIVFAWVSAREGAAIDGGCKDASRMFYLPTCRTDLDVEPVFGYNSGELLDPRRIDLPHVPLVQAGRLSSSPSSTTNPSSDPAPRPSKGWNVSGPEGGAVVGSHLLTSPARQGAQGHAGRGVADSPYAGIDAVEQREDLALIESRCRFMAHVRADAATLSQSEWYAALSIIARCRGGDDLAHEVSSPYPGYDEAETEETYQRAKVSAGPRTCADIRKLTGPGGACAGCPLQIKSPVLLGRSPAAVPSGTSTTNPPPSESRSSQDGTPEGGGAVDLQAAIVEAEARQQQARLVEDAALVAVENARRRLAHLRKASSVASEDDLSEGVRILGDAREAHRLAERTRKARERDTAAARRRTSVEGLPPGADPAVWQRLRMNREGMPLNVTANLLTVLDDDPRWSSRLTYDEFSLDVCLDGAPLPEEQATRLVGKLGHDYHLDTSTPALLECVRATAVLRRFHPVRDWLGSLRWDGTPRVQDLMLRGFGALPRHDEELVRLLGERFLLSLVARAMKAGAQVDTVLVLTGKQGKYKTTSFETLVGEQWFMNTKMDLSSKDSFIALRGKWLVEFGEMAAVRRSDDNTSKGWITQRKDTYRAPYAKRAEDHPRSTVACGTANGEDYEFLQDPTGYRRYWPVTVDKADLGWLADNRAMLFAEAVVLYGQGRRWWFDEDTEESERLKRFVAPFIPAHPWTEEIARWLEATKTDRNLEVFSITTVLTRCIQRNLADIKHGEHTTVGNILKAIGCTYVESDYDQGVYSKHYRRPARMLKASTGGTVVNISRPEPARA
jgi:predicted P-loop ATPase